MTEKEAVAALVEKEKTTERPSFGEWKRAENVLCPRCRCSNIRYREHELSDGISEMKDDQYRCTYCQHVWPSHGSAP